MLDPTGPTTYDDIAASVGVSPEEVEKWFADPHFRSWLLYELDTRAGVQVGLIWRSLMQLAQTAPDPRVRLDAARMVLNRFDPGMRAGERDVARGVEAFGKELAKEVVKTAGPRTIHATVVTPRSSDGKTPR